MADPAAPEDLSLELVRRIQAGDQAAWEGLYRRYHDALLLAIRHRLGARLRAWVASEDILQSVVKDALADLERFEPRGAGSLRGYLHACVRNKIRAKAERLEAGPRARERRLPATELEALGGPSGPSYLDSARFERLEAGLARLDAPMREVVLLRSVEGLGNEEAAERLGRSPAATSKLYNRALARLGLWMRGEA